jgi:hypothetical protein
VGVRLSRHILAAQECWSTATLRLKTKWRNKELAPAIIRLWRCSARAVWGSRLLPRVRSLSQVFAGRFRQCAVDTHLGSQTQSFPGFPDIDL